MWSQDLVIGVAVTRSRIHPHLQEGKTRKNDCDESETGERYSTTVTDSETGRMNVFEWRLRMCE